MVNKDAKIHFSSIIKFKNIHAYVQSPWTQTTVEWELGRGGQRKTFVIVSTIKIFLKGNNIQAN